MTWPTVVIDTTHTDATGDNPQLARADIKQAMDNANAMKAHFDSAEVSLASAATTDIGNQASNRVMLTGSATITSLGTTYSGPVHVRVGAGAAPVLTYDATALITPNGLNMTLAAGDSFTAVPKATTGTANGWLITGYMPAGGLPVTDRQLQGQLATAYTTAGSAGAYTVTAVPAVTLAAKQRLRLNFNFSTSGACTLAANGLTAKSLKQYDSGGAKVNPVIVANMLADVEYDGTDWVILDALPPAVATAYVGYGTKATLTTDITGLASATAATIGWDAEAFDDEGLHSNVTNNSRMTVTVTARYRVSFCLSYGWNTGGTYSNLSRCKANLLKNGSALRDWRGTTYYAVNSGWMDSGHTSTISLCGSDEFDLTAGDYLEMQALAVFGGSMSVLATDSFFLVERVKG